MSAIAAVGRDAAISPAVASETASKARSSSAQKRKPVAKRGKACVWRRRQRAVVTEVLSATEFRLDDGTRLTLANVLAPRASDVPGARRGAWPMEPAARASVAKRLLGRNIAFATVTRQPDRYGRRPAQVWLAPTTPDATASKRANDGDWLQARLLADGLVRLEPTWARTSCASRLATAERAARAAGKGLWALAAYRVRSAWKSRALSRLRGTYQLVTGRVRKASEVRGKVYLNFGRNWRRDFTILIGKRQRAYFKRRGIDLMSLGGRTVLVRGWIDQRGGPMIAIEHTHQLEVQDQPAPTDRNAVASSRNGPQRGAHHSPKFGPSLPLPTPLPAPEPRQRRLRPDLAGPGEVDL
ncbi:MAG: thermonuclease family protein [Pseudomonadota bacterium]